MDFICYLSLLLLLFLDTALINLQLVNYCIYSCRAESNEVIDANLSARVLQLINFMDTGSYVQVLLTE